MPNDCSIASIVEMLDGGHVDRAWSSLDTVARAVSRTRRGEEPRVSELLVRAMRDNAAALRRAHPQAPLRAWMIRLDRNVRYEHERRDRALGDSSITERAVQPRSPKDPAIVAGWADVDLGLLTEKQRAVFVARCAGESEDAVATRLGVSRAAVRGRLLRAVRRLKASESSPALDRSWAQRMIHGGEIPRGSLSAKTATMLLTGYVSGLPRSELARLAGVSPESVRKRLQRWKRIQAEAP